MISNPLFSTAFANIATVEVASFRKVPLEPVPEEVVEESETNPESQSDNQDEVEEVSSSSPPSSPSLLNLYIFPADDAVDKYLRGAGTCIII